jgi:trehalose-6-phosphatase
MIAKYTQPLNSNFLVKAYKDAHKRLFLFDYDVRTFVFSLVL